MSSELFTVCFKVGFEGNRSSFRPRVKHRAAVLSVISSRRTRLQLGVRASAVKVEPELQSVVDLFVNYLCLMFNLYF